MATTDHIILTPSSGSGHWFKATEMKIPHSRTDTIEDTIGGGVDKQAGSVHHQFQYALRVPLDPPTEWQYGSWADLEALWELNQPNATPSDVITLTDHFGVTHSCYFINNLDPDFLTTMLEGSNAYVIAPVILMEIP